VPLGELLEGIPPPIVDPPGQRKRKSKRYFEKTHGFLLATKKNGLRYLVNTKKPKWSNKKSSFQKLKIKSFR